MRPGLLQICVSRVMFHLDSLVVQGDELTLHPLPPWGIYTSFLNPHVNFHETRRNCTSLNSLPSCQICLKLANAFKKWNREQKKTQTNITALSVSPLWETQIETKVESRGILEIHHWNFQTMKKKTYYERILTINNQIKTGITKKKTGNHSRLLLYCSQNAR